MPTMGQPELYIGYKEDMFDADHNVLNEGTQKFLQGFVDKFASWVDIHTEARKKMAA